MNSVLSATNAPAAVRPVCWLSIHLGSTKNTRNTRVFVGLSSTSPTPPHSGEFGAHYARSWRPGHFLFVSNKLHAGTGLHPHPLASDAHYAASAILPDPVLLGSNRQASTHCAGACHPLNTATPATNLMHHPSCRWTQTRARTCAPVYTLQT